MKAQWSLARGSYAVTQYALHYVYGATQFLSELHGYLSLRFPPPNSFPSPSTDIFVYNRATIRISDPFAVGFEEKVCAFPVSTLGEGKDSAVEGRFDTVLVRDGWVSDNQPKLVGLRGMYY